LQWILSPKLQSLTKKLQSLIRNKPTKKRGLKNRVFFVPYIKVR
jgi:hypothetical protein